MQDGVPNQRGYGQTQGGVFARLLSIAASAGRALHSGPCPSLVPAGSEILVVDESADAQPAQPLAAASICRDRQAAQPAAASWLRLSQLVHDESQRQARRL